MEEYIKDLIEIGKTNTLSLITATDIIRHIQEGFVKVLCEQWP